MTLLLRTAALLALAALPGCSDRPPLAPVKGTVTLDGKPLPKGSVTFEAPGHRSATGTVVNGEITEVTTYDAGDGAPVGEHKVAVAATEDPASAVVANPGDAKAPKGNYMVGKSLIPARYNDPATSGLTATVQRGGSTVEIKLTSDHAAK